MDSSRSLVVARRPRALPGIGSSSHAGLALALVIGRPSLWLLGALGFALRGGIVLLTVPMVALPTLGEARLLLGDNLGTNGLRPDFMLQLALWAGVLAALGLVALVVLARTEVDAFAALQPTTAPRGARRNRLIFELGALQLAALAVLALAAVPLVVAIYSGAAAQIVHPTGSGDIYLRVLADVGQPLTAFAAVAVAVEMLTALLARIRLRVASGLGGLRQMTLLRQPLRILLVALAGWVLTVAVVLPSVWLIGLTFDRARAVLLAPAWGDALAQAIGQLGASAMLVLAVVVAIVLAGFTSAARAALWNVESLR